MPFLGNIGSTEIIIIAVVLLVLFGGKKVNEFARGIGEAGKELKKAKKEFQSAFEEEEKQEQKPSDDISPKKRRKEVR